MRPVAWRFLSSRIAGSKLPMPWGCSFQQHFCLNDRSRPTATKIVLVKRQRWPRVFQICELMAAC